MKQFYTAIQKYLFLFILILLFAGVKNANGATYYSRTSGNWDNNTTWSLSISGPAVSVGVFPQAGDVVYLLSGFSVIVNIPDADCTTLYIGTTGSNSTTSIDFLNNASLTVSGDIFLGGSGQRKGSIIMTNGGLLKIGGSLTLTNGSTLSSGSGTIEYNNAGAQTVYISTYNNLTLSGGGSKTITGVTINSILSMEGTATATGTPIYGQNATLQYKGTAAQTTGPEFPSSFDGTGGVIINNPNGVTLGAAKAIGTASKLTLTNGKIITSTTNLLSISNTATAAIAGGSATSYIEGPVKWTLPASMASGTTYNFPVGKGSVYLPFTLVNPITGTGIVTAQVEAFNSNPGGIVDGTLSSKSSTEYWSLTTTGNFTNSSVSISRPTLISPMDVVGGSATLTGTYTSLAGTVGTNNITNSNVIGTNRYFVLAQKKLPIMTGTIIGSPFCAGTTVSVPYTISGSFNAGNVFTAQLSSSTGSFASPVSIGTLISTSGGTINATIPVGTSTGAGYRIRVVSSNPAIIGSDNGSDLYINGQLSLIALSPAGIQNICGSTSGTPLTVTETGGGTITSRQWGKRTVPGGVITPITGATGQTYTPNGIDLTSGTWYIVCTSTPGCGSAVVSNEITVKVNALPTAPIVGTVTQPSCSLATGSVQLTGLPATGSWTLTRNPGGITTTGTGTSTLISGLVSGTYTFTVTNAVGCTSASSSNVVINAQPVIPTITDIMPSSRCGAGNLIIGATASEGTVNWYATETGGSLLGTGNTFTTPNISASTTYYAEAINGGCISSARVAVVASVITPPTITASGGGTYCSGSTVNLFSSSANITNQYWTGPNTYYSLLPNPVLSNVTASMSGTYRVTGSALSGINLVTNGNFEMGNNGFTSDYARAAQTSTGLNPEGTYDIVSAPSSRHSNFCSCPDHTDTGTLQMVVNGASTEKNVWSQTVNVNSNTAYQFTYWVQTVVNGNDASPSKLQLYVNDQFAGPVYTANPTTGVWTQFTYNWVSGSFDTKAKLELRNENFATGGNDFALDDIVFQQACEDYDEVIVTINEAVTAGSINANQDICSGNVPTALVSAVSGTGSGTISYEWQTNASGSYEIIPGATGPDYSPPALNSTTSYRRRTVSDNGGVFCYSGYTNIVTITVSGPVAEAGEPLEICHNAIPSIITLTGASVGGGASTGAWSILSGGGTLSTIGQTNPATVTYTPAPGYSGTVVLRLTSNQVGACAATDDKTITIVAAPAANAGADIITCSNSGEITITAGSSAENYSAVAWTSNGNGNFTNATSLTLATYSPGASDIENGEVTLTLTSYGNAPCANISSTKKIFIRRDGSWTGAVDHNWNNTSNWACQQLPTLSTDVVIANGKPNYPILTSEVTGQAHHITIGSSASVTVDYGTLQIAGNISNSGIFTATNGTIEMAGSAVQTIGADVFSLNTIMNLKINNDAGVTLQGALNITNVVSPVKGNLNANGYLTLLSTASQTALIEGSGTGNVTGNVNIQRYFPSAFGYKYFSSPFRSATVGAFASIVDLQENFPTFYRYDENNSVINKDKSISYKSGWVKYIDAANPLTPMAGYAANLRNNASALTFTMSGEVNNGPLSLTLYNHSQEFTTGYNLVGNPYPSPIDWHATGWTKANIDGAIYFFKAGNADRYTGVYTSYVDGLTTGSEDNIIAAMQGFFVHVTNGNATGTLGFSNAVRVNEFKPVFKSAMIDRRPRLRLKSSFEIQDALGDAAIVYFDPDATLRFDSDKDALKIENTDEQVPNIYTISPDHEKLSINGLSEPSDSLAFIPVGITIHRDGMINLKAENANDLPFMQVYLMDAVTGKHHDLKQSPEVHLSLQKGVYDSRFKLIFSKILFNGQNPSTEKLFTLMRSDNQVLLKVNLPVGIKGNLVVTNLLGQTLMRKEVSGKESVAIRPDISTGVYVITLVSGNRSASEKILMRTDYE